MDRNVELSLIRRAASGDRDAAESLVRAHQGGLYAYILRISGKSDVAEDVVQEAFIRALTHLDRFDERFRFSTWLFTIARRVFLNICDRKRAMTGLAPEAWDEHAPHASSESSIDESDRAVLKDTLQRALMTLPADQREVVVLFHQHGWPIALVASHLGMPEGTVKSHLHRGRQKLRETLTKDPSILAGSIISGAWVSEDAPPAIQPGFTPAVGGLGVRA